MRLVFLDISLGFESLSCQFADSASICLSLGVLFDRLYVLFDQVDLSIILDLDHLFVLAVDWMASLPLIQAGMMMMMLTHTFLGARIDDDAAA